MSPAVLLVAAWVFVCVVGRIRQVAVVAAGVVALSLTAPLSHMVSTYLG